MISPFADILIQELIRFVTDYHYRQVTVGAPSLMIMAKGIGTCSIWDTGFIQVSNRIGWDC
ncbi:MAG: hypothetical protein OXF73_13150 [Gammaproteobacteria bacterium]|nr:hypothetical protein [Gammaproteobacteria bacterium]MCY4228445.1 hypothetical protein [Gammaproteobacteria bacterium]